MCGAVFPATLTPPSPPHGTSAQESVSINGRKLEPGPLRAEILCQRVKQSTIVSFFSNWHLFHKLCLELFFLIVVLLLKWVKSQSPSISHKMLITAGHGRRPAMRVSERVCPTADLIPAMDCSKKSFSHYDWLTFKLQTIPLANLGGKKLPTWFWPFNFELMSHGGSKARPSRE